MSRAHCRRVQYGALFNTAYFFSPPTIAWEFRATLACYRWDPIPSRPPCFQSEPYDAGAVPFTMRDGAFPSMEDGKNINESICNKTSCDQSIHQQRSQSLRRFVFGYGSSDSNTMNVWWFLYTSCKVCPVTWHILFIICHSCYKETTQNTKRKIVAKFDSKPNSHRYQKNLPTQIAITQKNIYFCTIYAYT